MTCVGMGGWGDGGMGGFFLPIPPSPHPPVVLPEVQLCS